MMVARTFIHRDGKRIEGFIFGLSAENIKRLQAGEPILIRHESHHGAIPANMEIAIMYGETEQSLMEALKATGLIGPETKTYVDPRLQ